MAFGVDGFWPGFGFGWPGWGVWGKGKGKSKSVEDVATKDIAKSEEFFPGFGPGASTVPYTGNFAFIIFLILILIIFGMGLFGPFI